MIMHDVHVYRKMITDFMHFPWKYHDVYLEKYEQISNISILFAYQMVEYKFWILQIILGS